MRDKKDWSRSPLVNHMHLDQETLMMVKLPSHMSFDDKPDSIKIKFQNEPNQTYAHDELAIHPDTLADIVHLVANLLDQIGCTEEDCQQLIESGGIIKQTFAHRKQVLTTE